MTDRSAISQTTTLRIRPHWEWLTVAGPRDFIALAEDAIAQWFGEHAVGTVCLLRSHGLALRTTVRSLYAEALMYHKEVLTDDAELEADLGSILLKRAELLTRIGQHFRLNPPAHSHRPHPNPNPRSTTSVPEQVRLRPVR